MSARSPRVRPILLVTTLPAASYYHHARVESPRRARQQSPSPGVCPIIAHSMVYTRTPLATQSSCIITRRVCMYVCTCTSEPARELSYTRKRWLFRARRSRGRNFIIKAREEWTRRKHSRPAAVLSRDDAYAEVRRRAGNDFWRDDCRSCFIVCF